MNEEITGPWMEKMVGQSNKQAAKNRNKYPIQEQATQTEL